MPVIVTPEQLARMVRSGAKIISDSGPARLPGGRPSPKPAHAPIEVPRDTPGLARPRPEPIRLDSRCMPAEDRMRAVVHAWMADNGHSPEFRSKLETRFSQRLTAYGHPWAYELFTFRLAARTTYTPDFCQIRDGQVIFYETKGYLWEKDSVKLKLFARLYPFPLVLFRWERGQWIEKVVPAD